MARGKGFQGIVGLNVASTWGTGVACGAGDGIEVTSLETPASTELVEDMQFTGKVTQRPSSLGNKLVDVTLRTALRYEGLEPAIALIFGTYSTAPSVVDTSAYQHVLQLKDDIDGTFATLAYELLKDTTVVEIPSVKWSKMTLTGKAGQRIECELSGIGYDYRTDASLNTTTTIDSITLSSNRDFAMFSQGAWLVADTSTVTALASTDALYGVTEWSISVERALDKLVTTRFANKTDEPVPTGFAKVTGSWTFGVLENGTGGNSGLKAKQHAGTRQMGTLTITSSVLAGAATQYFQHKVWLPDMMLEPATPGMTSPGVNAWTQAWRGAHVTVGRAGFTSGYTDALTYEMYTQRATGALA